MIYENKSGDFEIYKILLDKYLEGNKNKEVEQLFDSVILTTHDLIIGKISSHQVDSEIYSLVTKLGDYNKKYFSEIVPEDFQNEQYRRSKYYSLRNILVSLISA